MRPPNSPGSPPVEDGLVDEYHLSVCPDVVGGGKRVFPDKVRLDLGPADERRFTSDVVFLRYRHRETATGPAGRR